MKFSGTLMGITPKEDKDSVKRIEIKIAMLFDARTFAELGECFGERVDVDINNPQMTFDLEEGQGERSVQ